MFNSAILGQIIQSNVPAEEQSAVAPAFATIGALKVDAASGKSPAQIRSEAYESLKRTGSALEAEKIRVLDQIEQDKPLTRAQMAAMTLIASLPVLIGGALKGKRGIAKGAEAGALGTSLMTQGFKEDQLREEKRGLLKVDALNNQIAQNTKEQFSMFEGGLKAQERADEKVLDRENRLESAKAGKTIVNVDNRTNEYNKAMASDLRGIESAATEIERVKQFMDKNLNMKEGVMTAEGVKNYAKRKISELDPNSPEAEAVSRLMGVINDQIEAQKGTQTEGDLKRLKARIEGDALVTTLPQIYKNLTSIQNKFLSQYKIARRTGRELAENPVGAPELTMERIRNNLMDQEKGITNPSDALFQKMISGASGKNITITE